MNSKIQYHFYRNGKFIVAFGEAIAKAYAQHHQTYTVKVFDNGVKIDEVKASDCFNVEPKEHESNV